MEVPALDVHVLVKGNEVALDHLDDLEIDDEGDWNHGVVEEEVGEDC